MMSDPKDITTAEDQLTDVTTGEDQLTDVTTAEDQLTDVTTGEDQLTDVTTGKDQLTDVTTGEDQLTDVTTGEDQLTDVTTGKDQLTDVTTGEDQLTNVTLGEDKMTDVTMRADQLTDVTTIENKVTNVTMDEDQLTDVTTNEDIMTDVELIADSELENELGEEERKDFYLLPLLVWLKIFLYLGYGDRLALSETCRILHDIYMESSVFWQSAFIHIGSNPSATELSTTDKSLLRAHSHKVQKAVFQIERSVLGMVHESTYHALSEAFEQFPLKHLEVRSATRVGSCSLEGERNKDLIRTLFTSSSTSQLCCLKVPQLEWLAEDLKSEMLKTLKNSSFTSSLTHLYLGCISDFDSAELCETLRRFQNLQFLTIPFDAMCNSLLNTFSEQLKEVHFIVNYLYPEDVINWRQMVASCPQLTVGMIFEIFDDPDDFIDKFSSVIPVSSIIIQDESRFCDYSRRKIFEFFPKLFTNITMLQCMYYSDLPCWQDGYDVIEDVLITAVSQCPKLDYLHFNDVINRNTVMTLATMRKWRVFEFNAKLIFFNDFGIIEQQLETLREQVSTVLGRPWELRPLCDPRPSAMGVHFDNIAPYHDNHCT